MVEYSQFDRSGFMGLIDIMRSFRKEEDASKEEVEVVDLYPNVCFTSQELQVAFGQWLEVFPNIVRTGNSSFDVCSHLSTAELMKKSDLYINEKKLQEVKDRFVYLLSLAGLDCSKGCTVSDFDEKKRSFLCQFADGNVANLCYSYGSMIDEGPQLVVDTKDCCSVYDYWYDSEEDRDCLQLSTLTRTLDEQGTCFHRFVSPYRYYGDLYNDEYRLELGVQYPNGIEELPENIYVDTKKMEAILASISFPTSIEEVCQKITEAFLVDASTFPMISICIRRTKQNGDKKESQITDEAVFKKGQFSKLTITKDGKQITVDHFDNWSYASPSYHVSQSEKKKISYGFTDVSFDDLSTLESPAAIVSHATDEVEEVKKLGLTLFTKKPTE